MILGQLHFSLQRAAEFAWEEPADSARAGPRRYPGRRSLVAASDRADENTGWRADDGTVNFAGGVLRAGVRRGRAFRTSAHGDRKGSRGCR